MEPEILLKRLDEIGRSLEKSGHGLALIGLGSVGMELNRLDEYSDLDFFAIVEPGHKNAYLVDLEWLSSICPIAYCFANTQDGFKLLFSDGIFCEFAVFEPDELASIPFAPGRMIWKQAHIPDSLCQPILAPAPRSEPDIDWLLGEALTNLLVGLSRERRGERLSAMRFIQVYAVDHILELADKMETAQPATRDPYSIQRRFEERYPDLAGRLPACLQGYERNRESALAILGLLEQSFQINPEIAAAIRQLAEPGSGNNP